MFADAVAAECDASVFRYRVPEKCGTRVIVFVSGQSSHPFHADHLGNLRIGVKPRKVIFMFDQRIKQVSMVEAFRGPEIFFISGQGIDIRHHFIHAPILVVQHLLHLSIGKIRCYLDAPVTKTDQQFKGLLLAGFLIDITQPGKCLVYVIPGHPLIPHQPDITAGYPVPEISASRNPADVSVAIGLLAAIQLFQHIVEPAVEFAVGIRAGGNHAGQCGKIVPGRMAVQSDVFPVSV